MQQPPQTHQSLLRRVLFPYSGEEALTPRQGLRVFLAWAIPIPLSMSLCALAFSGLLALTATKALLLFALAFLSGVLVFGILGWLVVGMNNRAAQLRQARRATGTNNREWR